MKSDNTWVGYYQEIFKKVFIFLIITTLNIYLIMLNDLDSTTRICVRFGGPWILSRLSY